MTNLCTPTMASAGAIVLRSQPAGGLASLDARLVAEQVWDAMERERIEDEVALRNEARVARRRENTRWNTPQEFAPLDGANTPRAGPRGGEAW